MSAPSPYQQIICNAEFLVKAGFSGPAAEEMFSKWQFLREKYPEFCPGLKMHTIECLDDEFGQWGSHRSADACGPSDDYGAAWLAMGVEPSLSPRLLAEEHRPIRLLTSASDALRESIRATHDYMWGSSTFESEAAKRQHQAQVQTEVDLPAAKEGHVMLYKAGTVFELEELEIAELQCSYKASFSRYVSFGILHIAVPDYLLTEQSNCLHVDDSTHWRNMIWQRRGPWWKPPSLWKGLSEDVAHYTARERVGVVGSICAQSTELLKQLSNEIQVRSLKLANGEEAKQYVALPASYNDLNDECEGLVWFEERRLSEDGMRLMPSTGKAMTRAMRQYSKNSSSPFLILSFDWSAISNFCSCRAPRTCRGIGVCVVQ
ncbi:hypothetical protein TI39_contig4144g00003 [Zymoseptoria brevis]|uniref:Uncharacterized protein n=1 Tax=Zymoseptoria brevis TaxID=1047168 RepID=A0A0F4GDD3_9PEZI|nr:hypothetical protein TI39_contig4144g00003 [Zymoseptoria brevis]